MCLDSISLHDQAALGSQGWAACCAPCTSFGASVGSPLACERLPFPYSHHPCPPVFHQRSEGVTTPFFYMSIGVFRCTALPMGSLTVLKGLRSSQVCRCLVRPSENSRSGLQKLSKPTRKLTPSTSRRSPQPVRKGLWPSCGLILPLAAPVHRPHTASSKTLDSRGWCPVPVQSGPTHASFAPSTAPRLGSAPSEAPLVAGRRCEEALCKLVTAAREVALLEDSPTVLTLVPPWALLLRASSSAAPSHVDLQKLKMAWAWACHQPLELPLRLAQPASDVGPVLSTHIKIGGDISQSCHQSRHAGTEARR